MLLVSNLIRLLVTKKFCEVLEASSYMCHLESGFLVGIFKCVVVKSINERLEQMWKFLSWRSFYYSVGLKSKRTLLTFWMKELRYFFLLCFFCISEKLDAAACGLGVGETLWWLNYIYLFFCFLFKTVWKINSFNCVEENGRSLSQWLFKYLRGER